MLYETGEIEHTAHATALAHKRRDTSAHASAAVASKCERSEHRFRRYISSVIELFVCLFVVPNFRKLLSFFFSIESLVVVVVVVVASSTRSDVAATHDREAALRARRVHAAADCPCWSRVVCFRAVRYVITRTRKQFDTTQQDSTQSTTDDASAVTADAADTVDASAAGGSETADGAAVRKENSFRFSRRGDFLFKYNLFARCLRLHSRLRRRERRLTRCRRCRHRRRPR
jgi:hypothetical protein